MKVEMWLKFCLSLFGGGDLVIFFPKKKGICDQLKKKSHFCVNFSLENRADVCIYKHGSIIQQYNEILTVNCTMVFIFMKHLN